MTLEKFEELQKKHRRLQDYTWFLQQFNTWEGDANKKDVYEMQITPEGGGRFTGIARCQIDRKTLYGIVSLLKQDMATLKADIDDA